MNFYKRHIGDYLKDTAHLTILEHGIYTRLLDVYYTRESGIPNDDAARLIGAKSKSEREALQNVLTEFFELEDGIWLQARCEAEISGASAKAGRNREVGKLGGRPRKEKTQTVHSEKPTENPDGLKIEPKNNPSQTPDSRLHKNLVAGNNSETTTKGDVDNSDEEEEAPPPPDASSYEPFAMHPKWEPSDQFPTLCKMAGVTLGDKAPTDALREFRTYWYTRQNVKRSQNEWDHAFVKDLKRKQGRA